MSTAKGISDATILQATGKRWDEWYAILDTIHAKKMTHTEIARYLYIHHLENNGWWCQMIANRYEQIKGKKKKRQNPEGFLVSVSKTVGFPVTDIYEAWADESVRNKWLREKGIEITAITPNTSVRMVWKDSKTRVSVNFYEKGLKKSQVAIEHSKLINESSADEKKKYWKMKLEKLSKYLYSRH